jgi:hypothetical protein
MHGPEMLIPATLPQREQYQYVWSVGTMTVMGVTSVETMMLAVWEFPDQM